jgi:Icc-related predicted phosphoesterase
VAPEFANYPYHSASINDHEGLIKQYQNLKIVIHGHVHQTHQYMIGNTSVYCNPLGIAIKNENPDYIKNLIIDI